MFFKILIVGALQVNCYIIGCDRTKEAVIVDPGDNAGKILQEIYKNGLKVKYVINTHAHFDHVGGNAEILEKTGAKLVIHENDNILLDKLKKQADIYGLDVPNSPAGDILVGDGAVIKFGELELDVIHTPGHTPGGISLKIDDILLTGDTLFKMSIGRTDFPGGSYDYLMKSIKNKLLKFDDSTKVYPGHGGSSTIGFEKKRNPYLQNDD